MTPWVATLFEPLEQAVSHGLGVGPEVGVRARPRVGEVILTLTIPGGEELTATWRDDGVRIDSDSPAADAIRRLQRAWLKREPQRAEAVWAEHARVAGWAGLKDAFYRRVFVGPTGVTGNLRLGFGCNQDCGLCWQSRRWPDPPAELLRVWVDEPAAAGVTQLTISGGEPTLRKTLPDLLDRARSHGMATMLQTNAIQLSRPDVLQRLHVDRLFVSLHAADPALSDRITRAPGTHGRTVAGVQAALAAGLRVGLSVVVDRQNVQHLPDHARFIAAELAGVESVTWSKPQPYFDEAIWRDAVVPLDEVEGPLLEAVDIVAAAGVVVDATSGSCGFAACLLRARPQHIHLPPAASLGMADAGFDDRSRDGTACTDCALRDRCQGPGEPYRRLYGDRGLVPFSSRPELPAAFPLTL